MNTAYLSIGSNIDPEKNLPEALRRLSQIAEVCGTSSIWKTPSVGYAGPDFLNAIVCVTTDFDAHTLKEEYLCSIEAEMGRVRTANKNAPRTIDLDILLFNQEILDVSVFKLDHLILPLAELIPALRQDESSPTLKEIADERLTHTSACKCGKFKL